MHPVDTSASPTPPSGDPALRDEALRKIVRVLARSASRRDYWERLGEVPPNEDDC